MDGHHTPFDEQYHEPFQEEEIERRVAVRLAQRAEYGAFRWRLRLILIETMMMGALVGSAGLVLHQPKWLVLRGALLVAGACFASGMLLISLSGAAGYLWSQATRWATR